MPTPQKSSANWDTLVTLGGRPLPDTTGTLAPTPGVPLPQTGKLWLGRGQPRLTARPEQAQLRSASTQPRSQRTLEKGQEQWGPGEPRPRVLRFRGSPCSASTCPGTRYKLCPSVGVHAEEEGWVLRALTGVPGLPSYGQMWPDVQARHLPGGDQGPSCAQAGRSEGAICFSPHSCGRRCGPPGTHAPPSCSYTCMHKVA